MAVRTIAHPTVDDRRAEGKEARDRTPLSSHAGWVPAPDRSDPVELLEKQNATREPDLNVQLCGDAHLSNFGAFASPERRLLFDLNDFDETLPGPFESVAAYREAMAEFAGMGTMDVWYARLDAEQLLKAMRGATKASGKEAKAAKRARKVAKKELAKAHTRDSLQALSKLGELVDGQYRIVSQPPIVVPVLDLTSVYGLSSDEIEGAVHKEFRAYRATLRDDQRHLLARFKILDVARKVVGVGSVGTRAYILLQGRDQHDPLFLQVKEATAPVLEDHLPKSRYKQHGERVVYGQRMLEAASDVYLGWARGRVDSDRHYSWRQLRDMKGSAEVETMAPVGLAFYARICGWTLARAHARSGRLEVLEGI
jgi:uncharacterized protein (DUF2252 family)